MSMSMKNRRSNREAKKPKLAPSVSPFATPPPKAKGAKPK